MSFFVVISVMMARNVVNVMALKQCAIMQKKRSKEEGLVRSGKVRINTAGCLNRCEHGPVMVIYPEATWYTWVDKDDIDDIIEQHLINDIPVERLKIKG